jgi:SAM-dependent methyltransferase
MNDKVSVNTDIPSPYIENRGGSYRLKRKLTYAFAFRLLHRYMGRRENLDVLEIGTGSGFFLDFAREYFPISRFSGVEYDERLLAETIARSPHAKMIQGNAENFNLGHGTFDLVVSFQVIEHLYNPGAMLDNVRAHLKPGGVFLVTTPNLTGLGARLMKEKWHGFRDDHVSLKSKSEWDELITSHGFKPLYSGSTFFSGVPLLNRFPLGIVNWFLLVVFGSIRWSVGESYVGVFVNPVNEIAP